MPCTAPNHTALFAAVGLKLLPFIVIAVPTGPEVGVNEEMIGGPEIVFLRTDTVEPPLFAVARSVLPSPSKSPKTIQLGPESVVKSTFEAKELVVMEPDELLFLKTEIVLPEVLATAMSGLPSPSISLMAMQ